MSPAPPRRIERGPARLHAALLLACLLLAGAACTESRGTAGTQSQSAPPPSAFTVSGTIPVTAGSAIDGDVNDPSAAYDPNDTTATAQEIANPVTLGGYANAPGTGAPGRSQIGGDAFDYYRAALAEGQRVRLFLAEDGAVNDLDLALLPVGEPAPITAPAARPPAQPLLLRGGYATRFHPRGRACDAAEVQLKLIRRPGVRSSSRPSVTPTGSSSKAQGKRSAALGTEVASGSTL